MHVAELVGCEALGQRRATRVCEPTIGNLYCSIKHPPTDVVLLELAPGEGWSMTDSTTPGTPGAWQSGSVEPKAGAGLDRKLSRR